MPPRLGPYALLPSSSKPIWLLQLCTSRGDQAAHSLPRILKRSEKFIVSLPNDIAGECSLRPQSPQLLHSPDPCRACSSPTAALGSRAGSRQRCCTFALGHPHPSPPRATHTLASGSRASSGLRTQGDKERTHTILFDPQKSRLAGS